MASYMADDTDAKMSLAITRRERHCVAEGNLSRYRHVNTSPRREMLRLARPMRLSDAERNLLMAATVA